MSDCSLLGWLNFLVLTVTGGVIAWYTVETYRLRREAQLQTELQIRPFLSLEIEGEGFERRARLVNIGRGVAMGISVKNITVSASLELRGAHRELTHLAPGAKSPLPLRMWVRETPDDAHAEMPIEDQGWNIAKLLDHEDVTVVVRYASLTRQWYETTTRMIEGTPRTPRIIDDRRRSGPVGVAVRRG